MGLGEALGFSKAATFAATVQIHELAQVPLISARFRIKWKFKGATHVSEADDAAAGAAAALSSSHGHGQSGFGKRFLHPRTALHHVTSGSNNATLSSSVGSSTSGGGTVGGHHRSRSGSPVGRYDTADEEDGGYRTPSRSPPLSPDSRTANPNRTTAPAFTSPFSAELLAATSRVDTDDTVGGMGTSRRRGGGDLTAIASGEGVMKGGGPLGLAHRAEPKGCTSFVILQQHTVTFNREITCPVQIPLRHLPSGQTGRNGAKYQLQPSPVRLSIKQEHLVDGGKKEEERLGEVVLDLSQFVGQKKEDIRPRRYLLQDCKSNAVLRVTVKMELIEGDASFVAPPLRSGQVPANSAAAKALHSNTNSPVNNRSTVSLNKSASAARLSTSTFSTSHTGSSSSRLGRANSVSSTGSSQSPSASFQASSENGKNGMLGQRTTSATSVNGARNGRGKKKGWHPPTSALSMAASDFPTGTRPHLAHRTSTTSAALGTTERSAPDLIESIFNRPKRQPSWVGFSAASRPTTPTFEQDEGFSYASTPSGNVLGDPFEYTSSSGGAGKKGKDRRSAPPTLSVGYAQEKEKSGKAWSVRSGIERQKDKHREKRERKEEKRRDEGGIRRPESASQPSPPRSRLPSQPQPRVNVQPPTPQPSFHSTSTFTNGVTASSSSSSISYSKRQTPPRRPTQPPPPVPTAPPPRPPSLASSTNGGRALSVRWGDSPSPSASNSATSSPLTAPTTLPSSSASFTSLAAGADKPRSLRHKKSTDSSLSTRSTGAFSNRSGKSNMSGLGLSTSFREDTPPPPSMSKRPPSQLSFNSVVTPPSPEKKAGLGLTGGLGEKEKKHGGKGGAAAGIDWADSWGGKN
ncbi:hypothetical protein JCM8547_008013 [Rhodosporidiobolus lusitaniae]